MSAYFDFYGRSCWNNYQLVENIYIGTVYYSSISP